MSEQLKESLSAVMDGEADAFELRRVLDEAKADEDLRERWHRMHLLRDIMRGDIDNYAPQLRQTMWDGLNKHEEDEEVVEDPLHVVPGSSVKVSSPWLGRITGTAVAATVALLIVVNGGFFESDLQGEQTSGFANTQPATGTATPVPTMYSTATAADRQRMNGFFVSHYQSRGMNMPGVEFAKFASFSTASFSTGEQTQIPPLADSDVQPDTQNEETSAIE